MRSKFTAITPELYAYLCERRTEHDPALAELAEETAGLGRAPLHHDQRRRPVGQLAGIARRNRAAIAHGFQPGEAV